MPCESVLVKKMLWCYCFTLLVWWRRWAGRNDMILALITFKDTSVWLTALSVTVMKPIQLPEGVRERERQRQRQRERENHWAPWGVLIDLIQKEEPPRGTTELSSWTHVPRPPCTVSGRRELSSGRRAPAVVHQPCPVSRSSALAVAPEAALLSVFSRCSPGRCAPGHSLLYASIFFHLLMQAMIWKYC